MSFLRSPSTWLRLTFRWSNSTQTWHERVGDLSILGGIAVAVLITALGDLTWWHLLLVWGVCLLPALAFGAIGWLKIFGPVLYYDMIRQSRRSRFILLRFLYALLLVMLLFFVASTVTRMSLGATDTHAAAKIAQQYFDIFMLAQFVTVVLLTPAYVGGAISDEKDRKTLEFMLATDLLNREIVLSKLGSRLANLGLVIITGLPILSVMQFLGGLDPNLVLAGFALTAMTVFGQAGVSILCSTVCKKPRESIALSYLGFVAYYALAGLLFVAIGLPPLTPAPVWLGEFAPFATEVVSLYNKGNLISAVVQIKAAADLGRLAVDLPAIIGGYAMFHAFLGVACTALAVARLRRVALAQRYGTVSKVRRGPRIWQRPAVGASPMIWKEINCEGAARNNWIAFIIFTILLAATFVPAILIVYHYCLDFYQEISPWSSLAASMNIWVRVCNVVVGYLMLLAIAVRASTSITTEREKQTLDTLLTTPLDSSTILGAKWTGSLFGVPFGMIWLLLIWALGIVTGGLHPIGLIFTMTAWFVYAAFSATLGMWFSVTCKTSLRATIWTITMMIATGVGHWLIWICVCGPLMAASRSGGPEKLMEFASKAQLGVLTPGFVLGFSAFSTVEISEAGRYRDNDWWWELAVLSLVGLVAWTIATGVLYSITSSRFRVLTHRASRIESDSARLDRMERARRRQARQSATPVSPWAPPPATAAPDDEQDDAGEFLTHSD